MAFCEMCGTQIPDGQTRCENCAVPATEAKTVDITGALNEQIGALKGTGINFIGLVAQIFNILMLCLPVLKRTHIWEIADMMGEYYIIAFAVIFSTIASVFGYLLKQEKIARVAGIVNLVALLIVWFPFAGFTVGFYLWLIGVVLQIISPYAMKMFNQYVK